MVDPGGGSPTLRNALHWARTTLRRRFYGKIHGPYAAYRSLARGLRRLEVNYNVAPLLAPVGKTVVVVEGAQALRRAIDWKLAGRTDRLLAMPVGDFPSDFDGLMLSPEIDVYLLPSEWIRKAWEEDAPQLADRLAVWAAGVDERYWRPRAPNRGKHVLVYWKTEPYAFCASVEQVLRRFGWSVITLKYGSFSQRHFRRVLSRVMLAVFISRSETQGIALAETWASDVPTLVWNPGELTYRFRSYTLVSASPYLTERTGLEWGSFPQLESALASFQASNYAPRAWILQHMTDELCARRLLRFVSDKQF